MYKSELKKYQIHQSTYSFSSEKKIIRNENNYCTVFGSGTLNPGNSIRLQDKTYGAGVDYNRNGNSFGYTHIEAPNSRTDAVRGTVNLYNGGGNRVNANAWGSHTRPRRQFKPINDFPQSNKQTIDQYGGNIEWKNDRGHGASIGVNNIPQFNKQTIDATGNLNIYRHKNWSVDAFGQASKNVGQFNRGRTDWSTGLTVNGRF
ncbi:hypothetical protein PVAND_010716 [Polypedilum vanderplanki]|uniref:Attacin C-terminal domain-containing protein n=1 Tax=Polypedilum vanderplanki TaxID=319348 RepID=A0A9J6CGF7_POLVA|nr:hypothetical protein PVAND_010716 [Polypedilum vanderplanki]